MKRNLNIHTLLEGLRNGNIATLSRSITLIESTKPEHQVLAAQLIDAVLPLTGNAMRIGITGVPGVGKSTFIESFGMLLIQKGLKVAVLAIDPSSNISKGSILGDKTRMEQLSVQTNAFIRPSASAGSLGGLTYKTREAMLLCEAAGFDVIIVETVGVGQSETEVSHITDFFLLLMLAGAGDELQGIKRGIMEMADGMVITKADGENRTKAKNARSEYARALHFFPPHVSGWIPEVKIASSYENEGIETVWEMLERYKTHQTLNGYWNTKRTEQNLYAYHKLLNEKLIQILMRKPELKVLKAEMEQQVIANEISPYSAVIKIAASL